MMSKDGNEAREGFIIIRRSGDIIHPNCWTSRKLRRVERSSATAELLSAADATDLLLYLKHIFEKTLPNHQASLIIDSGSLLNLATTTKEPTESLNKIDLVGIREAFAKGSLHSVIWTPGYYNISDALTKDNRESGSLLAKSLTNGVLPMHPDVIERISSNGGLRD